MGMEGLRKIGWFFTYWIVIFGGLFTVVAIMRFAALHTLEQAITFPDGLTGTLLIISAAVAYRFY